MQEYIGKDMQLIYNDSKGNVSTHIVRVIIAGKARFIAYCYTAQSVRTFHKNGVLDLEVLEYGKATG
ncbi:hypothetical protein [Paenibacillus endoradicis]|uniref:hypothetical protein n=1 Tax=Paenibacillus endoradicis TaxID=2972487 RepID=UPI002159A882|nr:hypothetical protein [Paenibacillus endoradicis]MCR8659384.1 hypothetical protein [Paenibacillus endoradicis]